MKWVDFWNYISLQVWGFYDLKEDYEQAQQLYGLTQTGQDIIKQYGGGSLPSWTYENRKWTQTNSPGIFYSAQQQKPKQTIVPKDTHIYYPTTRRLSQFPISPANMNKSWKKMIDGRFQSNIDQFLSNQPTHGNMADWDAGFYLIRTEGVDENIKNEIETLQHQAKAIKRIWEEIKNDPKHNSTTWQEMLDGGPYNWEISPEGYLLNLLLVSNHRGQLSQGSTLSRAFQNLQNMKSNTTNRTSIWKSDFQWNIDKIPEDKSGLWATIMAGAEMNQVAVLDFEPLIEKIIKLNPEDYEIPRNMWTWIHIDRDRKNNLRDIHTIITSPQKESNSLNQRVDMTLVRPDGTYRPRWEGDAGSDLRKLQVDALVHLLITQLRGGWFEYDANGSPDREFNTSGTDAETAVKKILTAISDTKSAGDEIDLTWIDFNNPIGNVTPIHNDVQIQYQTQLSPEDSVWERSYIQFNPEEVFPYLYDPTNGDKIEWSGWATLESNMVELYDGNESAYGNVETALWKPSVINNQTNFPLSSSGDEHWLEWDGGTGDAEDNLFPIVRLTLNDKFGQFMDEWREQGNWESNPQNRPVEKMVCRPRYYSTEGKSSLEDLLLQSYFSLHQSNIGVPTNMVDMTIKYDSTNNKWDIVPKAVIQASQPVPLEIEMIGFDTGLGTVADSTWKDPNQTPSVHAQRSWNRWGWLDTDGKFKSVVPPNRVGNASLLASVRNEPEFNHIDKYFEINHEICYWPNGFNLDTLPDSSFTSFINWNAGFTRILWEFLKGDE